jgi:hypothetical protein
MKRRTASKAGKPPHLIEKKFPGRKFVEFPEMKGRTVEKIEVFTTPEYHSITIAFQDKTLLNLAVEPGFTLRGSLQSIRTGNARVLRRWPPILSASEG